MTNNKPLLMSGISCSLFCNKNKTMSRYVLC